MDLRPFPPRHAFPQLAPLQPQGGGPPERPVIPAVVHVRPALNPLLQRLPPREAPVIPGDFDPNARGRSTGIKGKSGQPSQEKKTRGRSLSLLGKKSTNSTSNTDTPSSTGRPARSRRPSIIANLLPNKDKSLVKKTDKGIIVRDGAHLSDVLPLLMDPSVPDDKLLVATEKDGEYTFGWVDESSNPPFAQKANARTCLIRILSETLQAEGVGLAGKKDSKFPDWEIIDKKNSRGTSTTRITADNKTIKEYHPSIDGMLKKYTNGLGGVPNAKRVRKILATMAEEIHTALASSLPAAEPRTNEAPRAIGDCLADWMDTLDDALRKEKNPTKKTSIGTLINFARDYWLSHAGGDAYAAVFFKNGITYCGQSGLPDLAASCRKLAEELDRAVDMKNMMRSEFEINNAIGVSNDGNTLMRARAYGGQMRKVWETSLIRYLMKNDTGATKGILAAANGFRESLHSIISYISRQSPGAYGQIANDAIINLNSFGQRLRLLDNSKLKQLLNSKGLDSSSNNLLEYLGTEVKFTPDIQSIFF